MTPTRPRVFVIRLVPEDILVNTSRGPVVDETALFYALSEKQIWGAGLDVYSQEPIRAYHPLVRLPNVVALAGKEPKYRVV